MGTKIETLSLELTENQAAALLYLIRDEIMRIDRKDLHSDDLCRGLKVAFDTGQQLFNLWAATPSKKGNRFETLRHFYEGDLVFMSVKSILTWTEG